MNWEGDPKKVEPTTWASTKKCYALYLGCFPIGRDLWKKGKKEKASVYLTRARIDLFIPALEPSLGKQSKRYFWCTKCLFANVEDLLYFRQQVKSCSYKRLESEALTLLTIQYSTHLTLPLEIVRILYWTQRCKHLSFLSTNRTKTRGGQAFASVIKPCPYNLETIARWDSNSILFIVTSLG